MPLSSDRSPWVILRAIVGFGCAGIFVTTESWLTAKAQPSELGRVFLLDLYGRCFPRSRAGPDLDSSRGSQIGGIVQCDRRTVRCGTGHSYHGPRRCRPECAPRAVLVLWCAHANRTYRCDGLRLERTLSGVPSTRSFRRGCRIRAPHERTQYRAAFMLVAGAGRISLSKFRSVASPTGTTVASWLAFLGLGFAGNQPLMMVLLPQLHRPRSCQPRACLADPCQHSIPFASPARARSHAVRSGRVAVSGRLILVSGIGSVLGPLIGHEVSLRA